MVRNDSNTITICKYQRGLYHSGFPIVFTIPNTNTNLRAKRNTHYKFTNTSLQRGLYPGGVPIVRAVPPVVTELVLALNKTL